MKHNRAETPAYQFWVHSRPSLNGKSKRKYISDVRLVAKQEINTPIDSHDVEIDLVYGVNPSKGQRMDIDNVNKPTLDALIGIAYNDDSQVRNISSTLIDKSKKSVISGRVELMGPLFDPSIEHSVLIMIYSNNRLSELGGEQKVQAERYQKWKTEFDKRLSSLKKASVKRLS